MRFPLSWLKTWVDLPSDFSELGRILMRAGIGLETVEDPGAALKQVVVARVIKRQPHPNADRLSLCVVNDGSRDYAIVCGAPNVAEGLTIPLAKEGAELPGGFKIKKSKIRGCESEGMLCSATELGLPETPGVDGLLVLDSALPLGQPLAQALGLDDVILTLETTANRPDHLSLRGLAREVAALGGLSLKNPTQPLAEVTAPASRPLTVTIQPEACSYYSARRIQGVKVGPSPDWLRAFLEKSGIRSISNVVDATNCVLLEYGQPMHAFDAAHLGSRLEARLARPGEKIQTLDGQERLLEADDCVVADEQGPQALAGVMGGKSSEVSASTTDLVLEAAVFPAKRVRRSTRRLGLPSESSRRFERGVDPLAVDEAMDRCAALILELAGGRLDGPRQSAGDKGAAPAALELDPKAVNALLGTALEPEAMAGLLRRRFFSVEPLPAAPGRYKVLPPSWRRDLRLGADLAEEVLQVAGVDSVAVTNLGGLRAPDLDDATWENAWTLRRRLAALGLNEASTQSYLDPAQAQRWGLGALAPALDNPLSADRSSLRPSLLPGLCDCVLDALKRGQQGLALFEWGRVFRRQASGVKESESLALVLAGEAQAGQWNAEAHTWDFYDLKGLAEALARSLDLTFRVTESKAGALPAWAHPGRCAEVSLGGLHGTLAALHPALLKALDAPRGLAEVLVLELEPQSASKALTKEARYAAFPRVPSVERDLSCLMDRGLEAGRILDFIKNEGGLGLARLLDRFEGPPLPEGRKSLTFRLTYASAERSLTDAEVNTRHQELIQRLETALPVEVRR